MKIRFLRPNHDSIAIETIDGLEKYFGVAAELFKYDYYTELNRAGSLEQIDIEAYFIQNNVWFMYEDGDYLIRGSETSFNKRAA